MKSKNTDLNIEYNDNYLIMLEHETGAKGIFAADVVARKAIRHFEVFGEDLHVTWDGTPESLIEFDFYKKKDVALLADLSTEHIEGYSNLIDENPYRYELYAFLAAVKEEERPMWDFEKDLRLLKWIDIIEK